MIGRERPSVTGYFLANFSNSSILKTPNKNENFYKRIMEKHNGGPSPPVDVKCKISPFWPQALCGWRINMHIDVPKIRGGQNFGMTTYVTRRDA
jgi:hypothetical protein